MKEVLSISISNNVYREIESLRGREKRSTFVEHLIKLGLKEHLKNTRGKINEQNR